MKKILSVLAIFLCSASLMVAQEQALLPYPLDTINGEEVYRYPAERSIGLYRIGVNFNVSQNDIVRLNPQLKERGLHYGEILLIPTGRPVVDKPVVIESKVDTLKTVVTTTVLYQPADSQRVHNQRVDSVRMDSMPMDSLRMDSLQMDSLRPRRVMEIALMLPFESHQTKKTSNADRMLEFYQGALLALQDLQNDSTLYRLRVYDTERSERRVAALCDSTELDSVKGIIGLAYPIQIERMALWCRAHEVPLLLPFSDDIFLKNNPYLLQFNSTDVQEADSLCAWLLPKDDIHCVAVEVRNIDLASSIRTLRKQISNHEIPCAALPLRDLMNDSAAYALSATKENIIILHSDKFQQIRMLLPHLYKLQESGYRIRLVSQYSWQKESITLPQVYTSVFTGTGDRTAYEVLWQKYFVNEHASESPRYDLLGYDLTRAMIRRIQNQPDENGLQSDIHWERVTENGGWQNGNVRVIEN